MSDGKSHSFFNQFLQILVLLSLSLAHLQAATILKAGDIAVVGLNSDGFGTLALLALADINSATIIKVTDHSWDGSAFTSASHIDGILTWTTTDFIPAGTIVTIATTGLSSASFSVSTGSISSAGWDTTSQGSWGGEFGDSVIIYQGTESSPSFVYAFTNRSDQLDRDGTTGFYTQAGPNKTLVPSGLTAGTHALGISGTTHLDNLCYSGSLTGSAATILFQIGDLNNWQGNGGLGSTPISFSSVCNLASVYSIYLPVVRKD